MDKNSIIKKMKEYISIKENCIEEQSIDVKNMTFENLRDSLIGLGTILDEDFGLKSYILNVNAGVANMNNAIVAVQISGEKLYFLGYAKEGLINQHTARKAIDKAISRMENFKK